MKRTEARRDVNDLPDSLVCHKYRQERDPEKGACPGRTSYCRFRRSCLVWFAVHAGSDQGVEPRSPGPVSAAGAER